MNIRQRVLPIGGQDLSDLRQRVFIYVDKIQFVTELVSASKYYVLSHPRSFVKRLFLSTLKAYCEGNKERFKGLYLEKEMGKRTKLRSKIAKYSNSILYSI